MKQNYIVPKIVDRIKDYDSIHSIIISTISIILRITLIKYRIVSDLKIISLILNLIFGFAFLVPLFVGVFLFLVPSTIVAILCCFSLSTSSRNLATISSKTDSRLISFFRGSISPKLTRPITKTLPMNPV